MSEATTTRKLVSESYARAITKPGTGCCGDAIPQAAVAKLAGYQPNDLEGVPEGAAGSSFGCGNPLAFADVREGEVVLDLGSGAGLDLIVAARKVGPSGRVIGVDMTPAMIAKGRDNVAAAGLSNVEIREGIIEELPVETASVDWVISNCVINLSPEKPRVFAELARVLKPGGRVSVSDIVVEELPETLRADAGAYCGCVGGAISEREYVEGLRAAGLEDVRAVDRFVYEPEQVLALIETEAPEGEACCAPEPVAVELPGGGSCCGEGPDIASALEGKVASVRFTARKPGRADSKARTTAATT